MIHEFIVTSSDGIIEHIEADTVRLEANGELVLLVDKVIVIMYAPGVWRTIRKAEETDEKNGDSEIYDHTTAYWHSKNKKWSAKTRKNSKILKELWLGSYSTKSEAVAAAMAANKVYESLATT